MKEEEGRSASIWSQYMDAKRHAFEEAASAAENPPMTLEELEAAIAEEAERSGIPETGMPPRSTVHESAKVNVSKWFYRMLVALFVGLVAALFWWGNQFEP